MAAWRRRKVAHFLFRKGWLGKPGAKRLLARKLKVSYATICRDVETIMCRGYACPHCGRQTIPPSE
jgi:hypothetical protein